MLSQETVRRKISKFDRAPLAEPMTYRVVFRKTGNLQYFSHLDLQRTWQRVLVRASIPMWYTQGFNPHSKIIYGIPLPVGTEGLREMVDLRVDRDISPEEMMSQLNAELTDEMRVSAVYVPTTAFSDIAFGTYEMVICTPGDPQANANAINALFAPGAAPVIMTKRTKSGDKEVDIQTMIRTLSAIAGENGHIRLTATLTAGNNSNLNPEYVITAIRDRLGLLTCPDLPDRCFYRILRTGFLKEDGCIFA